MNNNAPVVEVEKYNYDNANDNNFCPDSQVKNDTQETARVANVALKFYSIGNYLITTRKKLQFLFKFIITLF